jgi:hypothetical protein
VNGTTLIQHILLNVSHGLVRLWRQNAGTAWAGKAKKYAKLDHVTVYPGDVVVRQGQPVQLGEEGIADLVGYSIVTITPEMVGQRVAIFSAVEVKGEGDTPKATQLAYIERIRQHGGRAGVAYQPEDAAFITAGRVLPHFRKDR